MKKETLNKYLALGVLSPAAPKTQKGFNKRLLIFSSLFRQGQGVNT